MLGADNLPLTFALSTTQMALKDFNARKTVAGTNNLQP